jgi:hypothetical protein
MRSCLAPVEILETRAAEAWQECALLESPSQLRLCLKERANMVEILYTLILKW